MISKERMVQCVIARIDVERKKGDLRTMWILKETNLHYTQEDLCSLLLSNSYEKSFYNNAIEGFPMDDTI